MRTESGTALLKAKNIEGLKRYQRKFEADLEDVNALTIALSHVLRVHKQSFGQDVEWIYDGILRHMKNKPKTRIQSRNLGMLAALLVGHGAVLNQVYLALEEWNKCSISTIKRGHYPIVKEFSLQGDESDIINKMFMMQAMFLLYLFESQIEKPFPRHKRTKPLMTHFIKPRHIRSIRLKRSLI